MPWKLTQDYNMADFQAKICEKFNINSLTDNQSKSITAIIDIKYIFLKSGLSIFASQGLRSALLIFTLGIVRRIFEVTRWRFICNAASGSCNQSERTLHFLSSCQQRHLFRCNDVIFSQLTQGFHFLSFECPENWLQIIIWLIFKRRFVKNLI
jgi:hypothetical protein